MKIVLLFKWFNGFKEILVLISDVFADLKRWSVRTCNDFFYDQFEKIILAHGVREVSELAYSDYIENILPNDEYLGDYHEFKLKRWIL